MMLVTTYGRGRPLPWCDVIGVLCAPIRMLAATVAALWWVIGG